MQDNFELADIAPNRKVQSPRGTTVKQARDFSAKFVEDYSPIGTPQSHTRAVSNLNSPVASRLDDNSSTEIRNAYGLKL